MYTGSFNARLLIYQFYCSLHIHLYLTLSCVEALLEHRCSCALGFDSRCVLPHRAENTTSTSREWVSHKCSFVPLIKGKAWRHWDSAHWFFSSRGLLRTHHPILSRTRPTATNSFSLPVCGVAGDRPGDNRARCFLSASDWLWDMCVMSKNVFRKIRKELLSGEISPLEEKY